LNASSPLVSRLGHGAASFPYRLDSSSEFASSSTIRWSKKSNTDLAWISNWSPQFNLGGLPAVSLQISSLEDGTWHHASIRLRGPDGHFARSQVVYGGHNHTMQHAEPFGDEREQGIPFGDFPLRGCISQNSSDLSLCSHFLLSLLEVRYVPTFTLSRATDASRLKKLRRHASMSMPFNVAGIGNFFLRIFPAGTNGPSGRCSCFLIGAQGVAVDYILRIGHYVSGTLETPLHCPDAGKGCWVKDAGPSWQSSKWHSLAVSLVSVMPRHWQAGHQEGAHHLSATTISM
jgi:hypothetical protein